MIRKNLANAVTFIRFLTVPVMVYCTMRGLRDYFFWSALIGFCTDMVDGTIARVTHSESTWGRKLDSIADFFYYPSFAAGSVIIFHLTDSIPLPLILLPAIILLLTTGLAAVVLTGGLTYIHLRTWQASIYLAILFVIVTYTSGVSHTLYYIYLVSVLIAGTEEVCIYIRDRRHTDPAIHSFFEKKKNN